MAWLEQLAQMGPLWERQGLLFVLLLARVSGLMMTGPLVGAAEVPRRVKGLLTLMLAVVLTPLQLAAPFEPPATLLDAGVALAQELLIGAVLGLGVMILLAGLQVAGQIIGQLSGMSLGELFDPTFDDTSHVFSQLLFYVTLTVFVILGGHRELVGALVDSLTTLPPGGGLPSGLTDAVVTLTAQSFVLGVRVAAPVATALLLSLVILAIIGRTVPQLNVLVLGFGLNSLLAIGGLALTLSGAAYAFQEELATAMEVLGGLGK